MFDPSSEEYGKAVVRGVTFEFTPAIINAHLNSARVTASFTPDYDEIAKEITGGVRTTWGRAKSFPSSQLTSKYAILERLALYNWIPSFHRTGVLKSMAVLLYKLGKGISFDLGALIFQQISRHAETTSINLAIGYPSLIFGILMDQIPAVVHEGELCEKTAGEMVISKKFFQGQHIQDIQGELIYPDLVSGVQEGVITSSAEETVRFLRSELAFLEAQERNLTVRKAEIISFLRTLGIGPASSSADVQVPVNQAAPVDDEGVPPSVPAPAAGVDVASSSVPAPVSSSVPAP